MPAQFTLDVSTLGGSGFAYDEETIEDRGRSIVISWSESGNDEDMEILGYSVRFTPGESEAQENL
jgi:hypothetical protein